MLQYGKWDSELVYADREVDIRTDGMSLSVHNRDRRYTVVKSTIMISGILDRHYYLVDFKKSGAGMACKIYFTWLDKEHHEISKGYLHSGESILALEGSVYLCIEALCLGRSGEVVFSDLEVKEDGAYKPRNVRVCAVSCGMSDSGYSEKPFEENVAYYLGEIDRVAHLNPDVILLTENVFQTLEDTSATGDNTPVKLNDSHVAQLCDKAREYHTYIVCSLLESDEEGVLHNTGVLINREGSIQDTYRKTHLTITEKERGMTLENELPVFDTDFGRIGILICFDHYFPEAPRIMAMKGAEMLLIPTHGFDLSRIVTRAMDNGIYVASAYTYREGTVIVAPDGALIASGKETGYAFAKLDLNNPTHIYWLSYPADMIPNNIYMNERRPELYRSLYKHE